MSQENSASESSENALKSNDEFCSNDGGLNNVSNSSDHIEKNLLNDNKIATNTEDVVQKLVLAECFEDFVTNNTLARDEESLSNENVQEKSNIKHTSEVESLTVNLTKSGCETDTLSIEDFSRGQAQYNNNLIEIEKATQQSDKFNCNNNEKLESQSDFDATLTDEIKTAPKQHSKKKKKSREEHIDAESSQSYISDATSEEVELTAEKKKKKKKEKKVTRSDEINTKLDDCIVNDNGKTVAIEYEADAKNNTLQDEGSLSSSYLCNKHDDAQATEVEQEKLTDLHSRKQHEEDSTGTDENSLCKTEVNLNDLDQVNASIGSHIAYDSKETLKIDLEQAATCENNTVVVIMQSDLDKQYAFANDKIPSEQHSNDVCTLERKASLSQENYCVEFETSDNNVENAKEENKNLFEVHPITEEPQRERKQAVDTMMETNEQSAYKQLKKILLDDQENKRETDSSNIVCDSHQLTECDTCTVPDINELSQNEEHKMRPTWGKESGAQQEEDTLTRQCKKARCLVEQQHMLHSYLQDISRNFRSMELDAIVMKRDIMIHKYGISKPSRHHSVSRVCPKANRFTLS